MSAERSTDETVDARQTSSMSIRTATGCLAPLLMTLLVSCSGIDLVGDGPGIAAGAKCVDARGANSTIEEVVDAMMNAPFTDPRTGTRTSVAEQARAMVDTFETLTDSPLGIDTSPEGVRAELVEQLYTAVPAGGDARFAAAVCGYDASVLGKLGMMWQDEQSVATTPHLLRASGRMVCGSIGDETADAYLADIDEQAAAAQADPRRFVDGEIQTIEKVLEGWNDDPGQSETARQIRTDFENSARMLREQDPQRIADGLKMFRDFQWLAVEHLCPATSVLGFGEVCGEVPSPLGHAPMTVRTHSGPVDCAQALRIVRTFTTEGRAAISPWTCAYNSDADTGETVMMYCHSDQARIVIPRRPA